MSVGCSVEYDRISIDWIAHGYCDDGLCVSSHHQVQSSRDARKALQSSLGQMQKENVRLSSRVRALEEELEAARMASATTTTTTTTTNHPATEVSRDCNDHQQLAHHLNPHGLFTFDWLSYGVQATSDTGPTPTTTERRSESTSHVEAMVVQELAKELERYV